MEQPIPVPEGKTSDQALIFGRVLDGRGGGRPIDWAEAQGWQPGSGAEILWLHCDRGHEEVFDWLHETLGVPETTVETLTSDETRPRAFRDEEWLITILRGINFNPGAEPEDMIAMQMLADTCRVVTLRRRPLQSPRDVLAEIDRHHGPKTAGDLVVELAETLVARMSSAIVDMNAALDDLEEHEDDYETDFIQDRITDIRRNCLSLKRHMSPQREALLEIGRCAVPWMSQENRRDIRETIDRLSRFLEDIDVSKESALVLQDDLNARAAAQAGRTNYILSLVAAIFLPLGFVTGLLGINVGGMPGVNDGNAFWITVGGLLAIFAGQMAIFKWLKWF
ncbi:zinc transporter ZntB [Novosphingopyxis sp.]|uniref:zinc transporter ZntB n=1 Tax=Novosphingopyxis sp. TaxID=2709690 RepID=UPI003B5CAE63